MKTTERLRLARRVSVLRQAAAVLELIACERSHPDNYRLTVGILRAVARDIQDEGRALQSLAASTRKPPIRERKRS